MFKTDSEAIMEAGKTTSIQLQYARSEVVVVWTRMEGMKLRRCSDSVSILKEEQTGSPNSLDMGNGGGESQG